jgi:hypothetical protein
MWSPQARGLSQMALLGPLYMGLISVVPRERVIRTFFISNIIEDTRKLKCRHLFMVFTGILCLLAIHKSTSHFRRKDVTWF